MKVNSLISLSPISFFKKPSNTVSNDRTDECVRPQASLFDCRNHTSPIAFRGFPCSTEHFELKKLYGLDCPCCGKPMPTSKQMSYAIQRIEGKKGEDLQSGLARILPFLREGEEEIANILIEASIQNPDANLHRIVYDLAKETKAPLENEQKNIIAKIQSEIPEIHNKNLSKEIQSVLEKALDEIDNATDENHFKKNVFTEKFVAIKQKYRGEEVEKLDRIIELSTQIPNSYKSKDAFFVKYQRKSDKEIVKRLFAPAVATTEHVKARSMGGENNTGNYIPMCGDCNFNRSNMPYREWLKIHPEMKENLQKYIDKISVMIFDDKFREAPSYKSYVSEIIKTIQKETEGEVSLRLPNAAEITDDAQETDNIQEEKTPSDDDIRANIEAEVERLLPVLEELKAQKDELDKDSEFGLYKFYFKTLDEFNHSKKNKAETLHNLSQWTRKRTAVKAKIQEAKKEQKGDKAIKELNYELKATEFEYEAAKERHLDAAALLDERQTRLNYVRNKITLPEDIQLQISAVDERIAALDALNIEIERLRDSILSQDEDLMTTEIAKLNGKKAEIEERMQNRIETKDLDSTESKEAVLNYHSIKDKISLIDSLDSRDLKRLLSISKNGSLSFMPEEARNSLCIKLEQISSIPSVQQILDGEELRNIEKRIEQRVLERNSYFEKLQKLDNLEQKLLRIESRASKQELFDKKRSLEKRKEDVKYKMRNVNIDENIAHLTQRIDELWTKFSLSFENNQKTY